MVPSSFRKTPEDKASSLRPKLKCSRLAGPSYSGTKRQFPCADREMYVGELGCGGQNERRPIWIKNNHQDHDQNNQQHAHVSIHSLGNATTTNSTCRFLKIYNTRFCCISNQRNLANRNRSIINNGEWLPILLDQK